MPLARYTPRKIRLIPIRPDTVSHTQGVGRGLCSVRSITREVYPRASDALTERSKAADSSMLTISGRRTALSARRSKRTRGGADRGPPRCLLLNRPPNRSIWNGPRERDTASRGDGANAAHNGCRAGVHRSYPHAHILSVPRERRILERKGSTDLPWRSGLICGNSTPVRAIFLIVYAIP
jgi:hypothetical protein